MTATGRGSEENRPVAARFSGVTKVYGGTVALAEVDFEVCAGEIHGLLGENGAGKSTLVKIAAGVETPDTGTVELFGEVLPTGFGPEAVARRGCAFIHQQHGLVGALTVAENVALTAGFPRRGGRIDRAELRARAASALARMGVELDVDTEVADLPIALRAQVAIARAVAMDARLLVLDEPTASLHVGAVRELFSILRRLRSEGVAIVLITHRIDEVMGICDRVSVIRDGRAVATRDIAGISESELVTLIVGREVAPVAVETLAAARTDRLTLRDLEGAGFGPLSLSVREGEMVAITGLADSGHHALGRTLFGLEPVTGGSMEVAGRTIEPSDPVEAMAAGIAYVPADRVEEGAATELTLRENIFMNPDGPSLRRIRGRAERGRSQSLLERFDVRPAEPEAELSTLSGGNAQKVVIAKWLRIQPRLLILVEPTGAVDVGARAEIYTKIRAVLREGTSVLLISSDFEEIAQVADRVVVLHRGRLIESISRQDLTEDAISSAVYRAA
ncbi:MAG: sugar ABC transporter ATP-binding protein [bacterium]|nr:sugar ABC transporter ATP-binding protein [bacterium]